MGNSCRHNKSYNRRTPLSSDSESTSDGREDIESAGTVPLGKRKKNREWLEYIEQKIKTTMTKGDHDDDDIDYNDNDGDDIDDNDDHC